MKTNILLAALLAVPATIGATAAQAQTGFRADVHAGWDSASIHQRTDVGISGATTTQSKDGLLYGGELGYDLSTSRFKLGVYAGLDGASTRKCAEVFTEVETCTKAGRNWTLGARAGVTVTPGILLYAKGGYSNGALKLEYIDHVAAANSFTRSENMSGYHVGGGVQVDLMRNVYAKLEYVRTDYEDYSMKDGAATITGGVDRDNVVFGVGVKF